MRCGVVFGGGMMVELSRERQLGFLSCSAACNAV